MIRQPPLPAGPFPVGPVPAGPLSRNDNVWSYRTGLMFQPTKLATYYVSYGSSFNPSAELYQLDDRTANTDPESSRNIEFGVPEWQSFRERRGDLSVFGITTPIVPIPNFEKINQ